MKLSFFSEEVSFFVACVVGCIVNLFVSLKLSGEWLAFVRNCAMCSYHYMKGRRQSKIWKSGDLFPHFILQVLPRSLVES